MTPTGKEERIPSAVDADRLAESIQVACNELDAEGYEVVAIVPLMRGHAENHMEWRAGQGGGGAGWGAGYGVTEGVVITARRIG